MIRNETFRFHRKLFGIDDALFGSLVGTGVGFLGNMLSNSSASRNAERQYQNNIALQQDAQKYNTAERQAAQQFSVDMWNKNNAYNAPSAQVSRLKAAGLNPLAQSMSGQSAQMIGSSPQGSSSASSVSQAPPDQYSFAQDAAAAAQLSASLKQSEANSRKTTAEAEHQETQNLFQMQNERLDILQKIADVSSSEMDSKVKYEQLQVLREQANELGARIDIAYKRLGYEERQTVVSERNADVNERNASTNAYNAETQRIESAIHNMLAKSHVRVDNSQVGLFAAQVSELNQRVRAGKISNGAAALEFKKLLKSYDMFYNEDNWDSDIAYFMDRLKEFVPFLRVK